MPEIGTIRALSLPDGVRVDTGIAQGDHVSTRYDPLVAKLIAHGPDRDSALDRLAEALERTQVRGVVTNVALLRWIVAHEGFRDGPARTDFLELNPPLERTALAPVAWRGYFRLGRDAELSRPERHAPPSVDRARPAGTTSVGDATATLVVAPMPGTVLDVFATAGQNVAAREPLLVLEAMKMETPVTAPFAGRIETVAVAAGEQVSAGDVLFEFAS